MVRKTLGHRGRLGVVDHANKIEWEAVRTLNAHLVDHEDVPLAWPSQDTEPGTKDRNCTIHSRYVGIDRGWEGQPRGVCENRVEYPKESVISCRGGDTRLWVVKWRRGNWRKERERGSVCVVCGEGETKGEKDEEGATRT